MTSRTILIVEDEPRIAHWLKIHFERAGFSAAVAGDGRTALAHARSRRPDLIVLDLMLPGLDGMQVCRMLRRESVVPIIMLTARDSHADRIAGLDGGADDYVVKPFDPEEVVARAKAVLRRVDDDSVQQVLRCGAIAIDDTTRQATIGGRPCSLSRAQFALLSAFMRHPNQVLSREQLITLAFDDFDAYDRAIDNHVLRLRKLLGREGKQPIQTVYGAGYRFVPEHS